MRFHSIEWGNDHLAMAGEARWSDRKIAMVTFDPSSPGAKTTTLYEGSSQDRYHSPGRPLTDMNARGEPVLRLTSDGKGIYFFSPGATPEGDLPFVGVMPVAGGAEKVLWRSANKVYTEPVSSVTPAQRGRGAATPPVSGADAVKPSPPRHVAMSWARRLKRVFGVEIEGCARCGGQLKIIASIEEPQLIAKILSHLERAAPEQYQSERSGRGGRRYNPGCCEQDDES
jgi:hypothetical protein